MQAALSILSRGEEPYYDTSVGVVGALDDTISSLTDLTKKPTADSIRKAAGNISNLFGIPLNNAYSIINSFGMYALNLMGVQNAEDALDMFLDAL